MFHQVRITTKKTSVSAFFVAGGTSNCFSTFATFSDQKIRKRVLTRLLNQPPQTTTVNFRKPQRVSNNFYMDNYLSQSEPSQIVEQPTGTAQNLMKLFTRRVYTNQVCDERTKHFVSTSTWLQISPKRQKCYRRSRYSFSMVNLSRKFLAGSGVELRHPNQSREQLLDLVGESLDFVQLDSFCR